MDTYQQKTLSELSKREHVRFTNTPGEHLKTLGRRLVYLYQKKSTLNRRNGGPTFLDDEIEAMFWIIAEYAVSKPYEVINQLKKVKESNLINFSRLQAVIDYLAGRNNNEQ